MEAEIQLGQNAEIVLGPGDQHVRRLRDVLGVKVVSRGGMVHLSGEDTVVKRAEDALRQMMDTADRKGTLDTYEMENIVKSVAHTVDSADKYRIEVFRRGRMIMPRTEGQKEYIEAMRNNNIVFSIGPAGTGKTYLAVACAVSALKSGSVRKIVLARPAVEAGEKLGFLPGDLQEKVNPYLRPLYDAMEDMMDFNEMRQLIGKRIVEIAPLAFMRGRTLNDAFVILDEGQNSTIKQMKMFLTRLGGNMQAVITGDITQVDLPDTEESGLRHARDLLRSVKGIKVVELTEADIVRHPLVQNIVIAYEKAEKRPRK